MKRVYYESDGDEGAKTHYLCVDNNPDGAFRIDFYNKKLALKIKNGLDDCLAGYEGEAVSEETITRLVLDLLGVKHIAKELF